MVDRKSMRFEFPAKNCYPKKSISVLSTSIISKFQRVYQYADYLPKLVYLHSNDWCVKNGTKLKIEQIFIKSKNLIPSLTY